MARREEWHRDLCLPGLLLLGWPVLGMQAGNRACRGQGFCAWGRLLGGLEGFLGEGRGGLGKEQPVQRPRIEDCLVL